MAQTTPALPTSDMTVRYLVGESGETLIRRVFDALESQIAIAEDYSKHFADVITDAIATSETELTLADVVHYAKRYVVLEPLAPYVTNADDGLAKALRQAGYAKQSLLEIAALNLPDDQRNNVIGLRCNLDEIVKVLSTIVP